MPPPSSRKAARTAGIRAAQQVATVLESVIGGPQAPAPAGWGVEAAVFRQAVPRFSRQELVKCASHFGQRGQVVGDLSVSLAAEVSRRLQSTALEVISNASPASNRPNSGPANDAGDAKAAAAAATLMLPHEVSGIVYSFSKLNPQLPEYSLLYDTVADGIVSGVWSFNRIQSALVATALADVDVRLEDALRAVLAPKLQELVTSEEACEAVTVDELRFLVHACAKLPKPGLSVAELEVLARCTERRLLQANFAHLAHLAVSWLRLRPPPEAKEAHLKALQATCAQLMEFKKSHFPAHPLPQEGLAPALSDLLAREAEQHAPPLTPPVLRDIVKGLVQISWGLQRYQSSSSQSRSLSIDDWSEVLQHVVGFCEAHSSGSAPGVSSSSAGSTSSYSNVPVANLPGWAAEVLYHVLWRAQQLPRPNDGSELVELASLLKLLRLVRRHPSKPEPDRAFFLWASSLTVAHSRRGHASSSSGLLADVVKELVPLLPKDERSAVARLIADTTAIATEPQVQRARSSRSWEPASSASPRLLQGFAAAQNSQQRISLAAPSLSSSSDVALEATLAGRPQESAKPTAFEVPSVAPLLTSPSFVGQAAAGGRLWGMLASHASAPAVQAVSLQTKASEQAAERAAENVRVAAATSAAPAEVAKTSSVELEDTSAEQLKRVLDKALDRVEALEAKLQELEQREASRKSAKESDSEDSIQSSVHQMQNRLGDSANWLAGMLPEASRIQPSAAAMTLHLNAFNFEAYRRENTGRLQAERVRVVCPPDNLSLILKK
eukprot:TRINITY_DN2536_c0_g1_i1.p1 TRINITY_DN2536_c0_g1~~TRINITY_DN2536_c0_g1_i1.p1  ORF type:complete len:781 (+),score=192.46 TRINITY_DN2536_c0_g1_i1:157-2499(+)